MSRPYGQEPGPSGSHPQQGGFPPAPSYPQGSGGLPQAPAEYGGGPVGRSGSTTAAAVLGFVQAGITTITTGLFLAGLSNAGGTAEGWLVVLAQAVGVVLLIWGGVQLLKGTGRTIFLAGAVLEMLICVYWLIQFVAVESAGVEFVENAKSAGALISILFGVMPAIGLILAMGSATTEYVRSRRA
jgi:hypothetical protein